LFHFILLNQVLQLDQCGRCFPDNVLQASLARSPKCLPELAILSLTGAFRLSDIGISALISSAPALRSINLSQCSLLTSSSIKTLADSLESSLKELYIDDCQNIDAMLILPQLQKLRHLEVFSLAGIQTVCDDFIREFIIARGHNMKELVLSDCV
jgi:DNA repair protein RAD7